MKSEPQHASDRGIVDCPMNGLPRWASLSPIAHLLVDAGNRIADANPAAGQLLGAGAEPLRGAAWESFMPAAALAEIRAATPTPGESAAWRGACLRRLTGTDTWVKLAAIPIDAPAQTLLLQILDANAERRAADELSTARRIVEEVAHERMDSVRMGSFVIRDNLDGTQDCLFVSDRSLEIIGRSRAEIMENFQVVFSQAHPDDMEGLVALDAEVTRTKQPFRWEGRMMVDGAARWLNVEAVPSPQADGTTIWDAVVLDVTTRKQAEEHLSGALRQEQLRREQAEQLTRAKSRFLASVSHEIRTPLSALVSLSESLLEESRRHRLPDEFAESLRQVRAGGHYLNHILTNLLDLSAIESGHAPLKIDAFFLLDWIEDIKAIVEPLARLHGVAMDWRVPDNDDLEVATDSIRLSQILLNLVHNAIKFGIGDRPAVRVALDWQAPELLLRVEDEGPGMDPALVPQLLEDYEQMPAHARRPERGIGLGLGIVRENVRLLNGRMEIDNRQPCGLSVSVAIPAAPP
jgi:PAS domain S-box-containing protein